MNGRLIERSYDRSHRRRGYRRIPQKRYAVMADAVVATEFDLVASASNHSYDWGAFGAVEHSRSIWDGMPVVFTGTAAS